MPVTERDLRMHELTIRLRIDERTDQCGTKGGLPSSLAGLPEKASESRSRLGVWKACGAGMTGR